MSTETAKKVNLFANKTVKKPATAPKPEKDVVTVEELGDKIEKYLKAKADKEAAEGVLKMLEADIKAVGAEQFMKAYKQQRKRPESFRIADATGTACLVIVMDKYSTVDENKAEVLATYDVVEEKTTYNMDAGLVELYQETLSDLIMNSPDIAEEHKGQLITAELTYSVSKGTIERLAQFENPEEIFSLIQPQVQLKK